MYSVLVMGCLFVLLKPSLLEQNPTANALVKAATAVVFGVLLLVLYLRKLRIPVPLVIFFLFRVALLVPTILNQGDIANWGYVTVTQLSLFMVIYLASPDRGSLDRLVRRTADLLMCYLVVNAWMVSTGNDFQRVWANGYVEIWYLLGLRTRITECFFIALALSMTSDAMRRRQVGFRSLVILAVGLYQVFTLSISTAQVGVVLTLAAFLVFRIFPRVQRVFSMWRIAWVGVLASVAVVVFRFQAVLADFLEWAFGKGDTLTGRTTLWDIGVPIVMESPVLGHGVNDRFGAFILLDGTLWQGHNQYLQLLYDGGFVGAALFLLVLLASARPFDAVDEPAIKAPVLAAFLAFAVMMVTEIYTYNMALFYLLPFIASRFTVLRDAPKVIRRSQGHPLRSPSPRGQLL